MTRLETLRSLVRRDGDDRAVEHDGSDPIVDENTLLEALANQRRRMVIDVLQGVRTGLTLREVARVVASRETGRKIDDVRSDEYKTVRIALYQQHLETLADASVIDPFTSSRDTIRPGPAFDAAVDALAGVREAIDENGGGQR